MNATQKDLNENNRWRILGPGGGGAQYIPTISPFDSDMAFVACDMTGSYLTYNGGETWRQVNFHSRVMSVAFDPEEKDTLYVGTTGLYKSRDKGYTWELIFPDPLKVTGSKTIGDHGFHSYISQDNWPGGSIEAICIDRNNPDAIFVGVSTKKLDNFYVSGNLLLFYSTDKGATWSGAYPVKGENFLKIYMTEQANYIFTDKGIYTFDTLGGCFETLTLPAQIESIEDIACGKDKNTRADFFYMTTTCRVEDDEYHTGLFRTTNCGNSWTELANGLDADYTEGQKRVFTRVAVSETDADVLYLALSESQSDAYNLPGAEYFFGIFKSEDKGDSFKWALRISDTNPTNRSLAWVEKNYGTGWGGAPFNLGVSPTNTDICYASDWGTTYKTINGGQTWEQVYSTTHDDGTSTTRGLDVTLVYNIHFDPFDQKHYAIACTDIALFDTFNYGESWRQSLTGVPKEWTNSCYCLAFDPEVRGRSWSVWTNCHDLPRPKMFERLGFDKRLGGVCKSDDNLATWSKSNTGIEEKSAPTCIILDPNSPAGKRTLYVTAMGSGVYKSQDDGATWKPMNNGITGNLNVWKLYLLPDGTLYLVIARGLVDGKEIDGALYRSTNEAESWEKITMPEESNFPNFMAYDPSNLQRIYLACWPGTIDGVEKYGGLYRSEDGGASWQNIFDESSHVYGVTVDPKSPSTVYLSNFENSVLRSDDRGTSWTKLAGYDFKWAHQPILDPYHDDMLFVATFGSSIWYGPRQ